LGGVQLRADLNEPATALLERGTEVRVVGSGDLGAQIAQDFVQGVAEFLGKVRRSV